MLHAESHFLTGNDITPGSIYVLCWHGQPECFLEEAKADKPNTEKVDCAQADSPQHRKLQILEKKGWFWPENTVCYRPISTTLFDARERGDIMGGIADYHKKTNIKFVPIDQCTGTACGNCKHALRFVKDGGCWSWIGYQKEANQDVSMACNFRGIRVPIHELGHAVGMQHEHRHPDRTFIVVPQLLSEGDAERYEKVVRNDQNLTPYDKGSVMHYGLEYDEGTCVPIGDVSQYCDSGQAANCKIPTPEDCDQEETKRRNENRGRELSQGDVDALNKFYPGSDSNNEPQEPKEPPSLPAVRTCDASDANRSDCCKETKSCDVGQGDCDDDSECLDGLKCGTNNCKRDFKWGGRSTDCCYKPEHRVCDKNDANRRNCCKETKSCDVGQGDCDDDSECLDGLKCGTNNCKRDFKWGGRSTDCCYKP